MHNFFDTYNYLPILSTNCNFTGSQLIVAVPWFDFLWLKTFILCYNVQFSICIQCVLERYIFLVNFYNLKFRFKIYYLVPIYIWVASPTREVTQNIDWWYASWAIQRVIIQLEVSDFYPCNHSKNFNETLHPAQKQTADCTERIFLCFISTADNLSSQVVGTGSFLLYITCKTYQRALVTVTLF